METGRIPRNVYIIGLWYYRVRVKETRIGVIIPENNGRSYQ